VTVDLSWPEFRNAAHLGLDRFVRNLANGRNPTYGVDRDDWPAHVLGTLGETAVAKYRDCFWMGGPDQPDGGAPDVGDVHVRTATRDGYRLLLYEKDADDAPYVLVIPAGFPRFRIVGWVYGRDGKRAEFRDESLRYPCFAVPQSALRPIGDLP
jgi:hypothetical protein